MLEKAQDAWSIEEAAHLLNRAWFGGSPEEVERLHRMGRHRAVDHLLSATDAPGAFPLPAWADPSTNAETIRNLFADRKISREERKGLTAEQLDQKRREMRREIQRKLGEYSIEAQAFWFHRILQTMAPLREKMTLFWHDHFATSIQKVKQPMFMVRQNQMFRDQALGSFEKLTRSIVVDPAMMIYLDTPNSRKGKPNENFAREVMELFTLGEGHYTEQDIREAARAFTGYQLNRLTGAVTHNRKQWDAEPKTIFGHTGPFTGDDVVTLIFKQNRPSAFIAEKLWRYFVSEDEPAGVIAALAAIIRENDHRVEPALRAIFLSEEFYDSAVIRNQIKCPVQFLVSMLKQFEITTPPAGLALRSQRDLGQQLFLPPNVAGWDWGQAWINTNTLLSRYNIAGYISQGSDDPMIRKLGLGGARHKGPDYESIAPRSLRKNPEELVGELSRRFFQGPIPETATASFIDYAKSKQGVVFTNKEVAELCHLMLSTPYYQLC